MGMRIKQIMAGLAAAAAIGIGSAIPAHAATTAATSHQGASIGS
jgi:hypothetical protein